ncbi:hypothetical protein M0R45_023305 [Rubus argutus]|uniref:Protein kinase domain-containing protein n=1 Tax=Rubus argutus TaxID=59490 RepID=A0AAW1WQX4_RUBAR
MGRETNGASSHVPQHLSPLSSFFLLLLLLLYLFTFFNNASAKGLTNSAATLTFSPPDNFLIDCGSSQQTKLIDGRTFKSDRETADLLSTNEDFQASADSISANASSSVPPFSQALYQTARIFSEQSTYTFYINKPGRHWIRLYFYPLPHQTYNLSNAVFSVNTDKYVLLHDFSAPDKASLVFKEYLVNVSDNKFSLHFRPKKKSFAFVNAIEVVSAPDNVFNDSAAPVPPAGDFNGLQNYAFQVRYRLNIGGPLISPQNDTLSRTWEPDNAYNAFPQGSQNVSVAPKIVKYPKSGATSLIAPNWVYASAQHMQNSFTNQQNFNLSWKLSVEEDFSYLIRLHFCDIVSKTLNNLYFNVYINDMMAISNLDLSSLTGALSSAFYKDFVLNSTAVSSANSTITIQIGPGTTQSGTQDALMNGVEVLKLSNVADSLDGLFAVDGKYKGPVKSSSTLKILAGVGLGMGVTAMLLVGVVYIRWQRRPQGWEKKDSFSSWLLPIHSSHSSLFSKSSKSTSRRSSSIFGSRKSKSGYSTYFSSTCYGRSFTFCELQGATQNWDEKAVIGVGGFGKVYLGVLEDGTKLAIKRGNPNSEQGINEFRTEMDMLSKLRHRHLVSLIGFCDENNEMILVRQQLTEKSDVYSFGVVLFEALCARTVINPALPREQVSLAEWAMQWHRKGMIEKIVDPHIASSITDGSLKKYVEAAEKCLAEYGVDRPSMGDVLWNLEYALQLQETASQVDAAEDNTSSLISLDKANEKDDTNSKEGSALGVAASEDSQVTVGSPLFAKGNVQGR